MGVSVDIYNKIKSACYTNSNVKAVSLWNNQPVKHKAGDTNAIRYPFVGIQFESNYNQLSSGYQQIDGVFVLYLCTESLKHKDEDVLMFKDSVHQTLMTQLPANGFGDLYRSFEVQDTDHDKGLLIWQQEYQYSYIDDTAKDYSQSLTGWTLTETTNYL